MPLRRTLNSTAPNAGDYALGVSDINVVEWRSARSDIRIGRRHVYPDERTNTVKITERWMRIGEVMFQDGDHTLSIDRVVPSAHASLTERSDLVSDFFQVHFITSA
jgi:hypothetical protein